MKIQNLIILSALLLTGCDGVNRDALTLQGTNTFKVTAIGVNGEVLQTWTNCTHTYVTDKSGYFMNAQGKWVSTTGNYIIEQE